MGYIRNIWCLILLFISSFALGQSIEDLTTQYHSLSGRYSIKSVSSITDSTYLVNGQFIDYRPITVPFTVDSVKTGMYVWSNNCEKWLIDSIGTKSGNNIQLKIKGSTNNDPPNLNHGAILDYQYGWPPIPVGIAAHLETCIWDDFMYLLDSDIDNIVAGVSTVDSTTVSNDSIFLWSKGTSYFIGINSGGAVETVSLDTITVLSGGGITKPVYLSKADQKWRLADRDIDSTLAHAVIVDSLSPTSFVIQSIGVVTISNHGFIVGESYSLSSTAGESVISSTLTTGLDQWLFTVRDSNKIDIKLSAQVLVADDIVLDTTIILVNDSVLKYTINGVLLRYDTIRVIGSETKVSSGTNVTITGSGTVVSPYVINSTASGSTGSSFGISMAESGSIASALAAVTSSRTTLIVDSIFTLVANVTIPDSVNLFFVDDGKFILSSFDLTINGCIDADLIDIFDTSSSGEIQGNGKQTIWYPEWFGAVRNDTIHDTDPFIWTMKTINNHNGGVFQLSTGTYSLDSSVVVYDNTTVRGQGRDNTIIVTERDPTQVRYISFCGSNSKRLYHFRTGTTEQSDNLLFEGFSVYGFDTEIGLAEFDTTGKARVIQPIGNHMCPTGTGTAGKDIQENVTILNCAFYNITAIQLGGRYFGAIDEDSLINTWGLSDNLQILNNIIDTTSNKAIEVQEARNIKITGNIIKNSESGIQVINYCQNFDISHNIIEGYWNAGISISSGSDYGIVSNNLIRYDSLAGTRNLQQELGAPAAIDFKAEDEQHYLTTDVKIFNNIFDGRQSLEELGYRAVGVGFVAQVDSVEWRDIECYNNTYIKSTFKFGGFHNSISTLWGWTNNLRVRGEQGFYPDFSNQRSVDSTKNVFIEDCTFSDDLIGLLSFPTDSFFLSRNNMKNVIFEFEPTLSGTNNGYTYNTVRDTATVFQKTNFYGLNIITREGLDLELDSIVAIWDVGGTVIITNDSVASWLDSSPAGNDLTALAVDRKPILGVDDKLNGWTAVRFPSGGTDKFLTTSTTGLVDTAYSIFMLSKPRQDVAYVMDIEADGTSETNFRMLSQTGVNEVMGSFQQGTVKKLETGPDPVYDYHFYHWSRSNTTFDMYRDDDTVSLTVGSASEDNTEIQIGGRYEPPTRDQQDEFDVLSIIILKKSSTSADRAKVKSYWAARYGYTF